MLLLVLLAQALANELLPSTKGHGMGWGWAVWTFGFAFLPPLQIFQLISAKLNPAMCLAQAIWGNITWVDFVVLSLAEVAGAFVGAVLHWLHFYPHWRTLPEPPAEHSSERLLRRRDVAADNALRFAGYTTRRDRVVRARNPLSDLRYRLTGAVGASPQGEERSAQDLLHEYYHDRDPVHRAASLTGAQPLARDMQPLARRTLQVADLQRHLAAKHVEGVLRHRTCPSCADTKGAPTGGNGDAAAAAPHDQAEGDVSIAVPQGEGGSKYVDEEKKRALALYEAALVADRNLKLSIFATRPAINAPLFNLLTETMGTTALILIALLIELQARRLPSGAFRQAYVVGLQPLLITFSIVMLISGLGGPTTYAANPARDFGPRLAHFLLPIPNKGSSEWVYSWVPIVGPLIGGAIAGGLYIAIEDMTFPGNGVFA
ncbi:putative glycerol uptake facilitator protein [Monoraphidium neglectum]|uniref:Putative glycerol uptake facilitator protein n=1 Tax=Monoraphidium neglectum TaxID=145388 RepID=A0A0D2MM17_9CHLO|nr:putative glycerol uptake facilitator protein [Monoraphidium neglectum]KIY95850.1 putative glycerol uptake facilitator protein [Monoraphidium neglectum]|eukprot:XP_013894870.1 putative glycerol uptake facilitator protein [Monoraphidium neglectum]